MTDCIKRLIKRLRTLVRIANTPVVGVKLTHPHQIDIVKVLWFGVGPK